MSKAAVCQHGIATGDYCEPCVEKDICAELDRIHRKDCLEGLVESVRQRCNCDQDNSFSLWRRLLYVAKVILCIVIRRRGGCRNRVEVALIFEGHDGMSWQSLFVGPGLFREWYYDAEWDSAE